MESVILTIPAPRRRLRLTTMTEELPSQRVEATFVGSPPAGQIARAAGVTEVEVDGPRLSCLVCGSFQPFLEALRGYEVIGLSAMPAHPGAEGHHEPSHGEEPGLEGGGG
jgi:hypothetical protein